MCGWTSCANRPRNIVGEGGSLPPFNRGVTSHERGWRPQRESHEDGELLRMLIAECYQEPTNPPPERSWRHEAEWPQG